MVQLSTGTPKEAREAENWIQSLGGNYVDGATMDYPADIGRADTIIFAAGDESAFRRAERFLHCLGGDARYVGVQAGAAAALDFAMLSYTLGSILGLIHGGLVCQSESVNLDRFGEMFSPGMMNMLGREAKHQLDLIARDDFANPGASLAPSAVKRIRQQAHDSGQFRGPRLLRRSFSRAMAKGYGKEDVVALIKVPRLASTSRRMDTRQSGPKESCNHRGMACRSGTPKEP